MKAFSYKELREYESRYVFVIDYKTAHLRRESPDCFNSIKEALEYFGEEYFKEEFSIWVHERCNFSELLNADSCFEDLLDSVDQLAGDYGRETVSKRRHEFIKIFNQWKKGFNGYWYSGERLGYLDWESVAPGLWSEIING